MGWKTIIINNTTKVSLYLNNLKVYDKNEYFCIPIKDIETVIFEYHSTSITIPILVKLLENNINIILCNDSHDPMGIFLPFNNHCNAFKKLNSQINWQEGMKHKLWTLIIKEKIKSQKINLEIENLDFSLIDKHCNKILLNDKTNREGIAAKIYFSIYFEDFIRFNDDVINAALNYGYKIIASYISRLIASRGYLTQLGIHHIGESNPYNLTYDFIEPFRFIVDRFVYQFLSKADSFLMIHRVNLVNILNCKVKLNNVEMYLTSAIDKIIDSYFAFLNKERENILM